MITSKQKWLPFWRFFCHLCSQRGLELHVWFHSVQSECVAVRGEKDHVVFWCSNGIGCHCWAFDQFHKEWPVRKSYCLTEVCEWMFFHFSSMFSLCIPPRLYTLLGVYYKSMFSQLLAHFVCQTKSMFREDYCSVHELCADHSTVDSLFILIWCDWEWF